VLAAVFIRFFISCEVYKACVAPAHLAATQAAFNVLLPTLAFTVDHISAIHANTKPGFSPVDLNAFPREQGRTETHYFFNPPLFCHQEIPHGTVLLRRSVAEPSAEHVGA